VYRSRRELTAETRRALSKEFRIKKYSELCELWVSVVNASSTNPISFHCRHQNRPCDGYQCSKHDTGREPFEFFEKNAGP
jgi:hypothetical protein